MAGTLTRPDLMAITGGPRHGSIRARIDALGSEYAFIDKTNVLRGLIDTFAVVYPQLYDLDFRVAVPRLEVPVTRPTASPSSRPTTSSGSSPR